MSTVLVLARETPYPPNAGDRVVTHGFVRGLAERGHAVHVVAYGTESDRERAEGVADHADSVRLVPRAKSDLPARLRKLRNYARGRSDVMAMFGSPSMVTAARERIRDLDPDAVLAEHPYIGQVFRDSGVRRAADEAGATLVTNAHVVEFAVHRRYRDLAPDFETEVELHIETPRLRREELAVYEASDRVLVLGSEDRAELDAAGVETPIATQHVALDPEEYEVGSRVTRTGMAKTETEGTGTTRTETAKIETGETGTTGTGTTKTETMRTEATKTGMEETGGEGPQTARAASGGGDRESKSGNAADLLFFGSYGWFPNEDAITTFAGAAWPRIRSERPDVRLVVAGKDAPDSVRNLNRKPGVEFVGEIPDLGSAVRDAAAVIAPLRIGGGTRLKVLESMAWGAPVVTTTAGFEGVDARPGAEVAVADDWEAFAERAVEVLDSPEVRARLSRNARRRIEQVYALEQAAAELEANLGLRTQ